jgi:hypothetical protein
MKLHCKTWSWFYPGPLCILVGLSPLQALLGFVALNPTYILPVLWRNAKPNNGRFRNRAPKVSFSINPVVFLAGNGARKSPVGKCLGSDQIYRVDSMARGGVER